MLLCFGLNLSNSCQFTYEFKLVSYEGSYYEMAPRLSCHILFKRIGVDGQIKREPENTMPPAVTETWKERKKKIDNWFWTEAPFVWLEHNWESKAIQQPLGWNSSTISRSFRGAEPYFNDPRQKASLFLFCSCFRKYTMESIAGEKSARWQGYGLK